MTWAMEFCPNDTAPSVKESFQTREECEQWVRDNAPDLLDEGGFSVISDTFFQYGTGYRWVQFRMTAL